MRGLTFFLHLNYLQVSVSISLTNPLHSSFSLDAPSPVNVLAISPKEYSRLVFLSPTIATTKKTKLTVSSLQIFFVYK